MKIIVHWEWNEEDTEELIKKSIRIDRVREKESDRFPTSISNGSWILAREPDHPRSGFSLYEGTEEQLKRWTEFYKPELKITKISNIVTAQEYVKELKGK